MKTLNIFFLSLIIIVVACQQTQTKSDLPVKNPDGSWIKKAYYEKSGKLKSEITVKNKKKNGPAKEYYPSGKLRTLVNYVDNVTVGETIWYYENGQPYRVTPYINGKMEGIRKTYYDNGKLQAEIPYKNGEAIEGLKEYDKYGKLITNYPQIVFELKNNLKVDNKIILTCKLDKNARDLIFLQEIINSDNKKVLYPLPINKGISRLEFYIPSQTTVNKTVTIWAKFKTILGNPYTINKTYQLKIDTY